MKKLGIATLLLGIVALIAGLVMQFIVVPAAAQFPDDTDVSRTYEGELGVLLNPDALASNDLANLFLRDVPVTVDRQVDALETDGGNALVSDVSIVNSPAGPILSSEDYYTIDRKTMEHVENFTDDDRVTPREGLVVGFPIGTEARDYVGWNGDTQEVNTLTYVSREERAGLDTLHFTASGGPDRIVDPEMLAMFPPALPKAAIAGLLPALGLPDEAAAQVAATLEALPDPVPLGYTYSYETRYWVEPDSGVVVDYARDQSRVVGIDVGGQFVPLTEVMQLSVAQTDASVSEAADEAKDAENLLFWVGRVLPWGLLAIGVVLTVLGFLWIQRGGNRRPPGEDSIDLSRSHRADIDQVTPTAGT